MIAKLRNRKFLPNPVFHSFLWETRRAGNSEPTFLSSHEVAACPFWFPRVPTALFGVTPGLFYPSASPLPGPSVYVSAQHPNSADEGTKARGGTVIRPRSHCSWIELGYKLCFPIKHFFYGHLWWNFRNLPLQELRELRPMYLGAWKSSYKPAKTNAGFENNNHLRMLIKIWE